MEKGNLLYISAKAFWTTVCIKFYLCFDEKNSWLKCFEGFKLRPVIYNILYTFSDIGGPSTLEEPISGCFKYLGCTFLSD